LSVRLADGTRDQHVTKACRSLSFTKTAPGGHSDASMRLLIDRKTWADLGDSDQVWIYDRRSGATAWEGYTTFPDLAEDRLSGQSIDLAAKGGADLLLDDRRALVYIDQGGDAWSVSPNLSPSAQTSWAAHPNGNTGQGVLVGFPPGYSVGTGATAGMGYVFDGSDMEFGAIAFAIRGGSVDAGYQLNMLWSGTSPGSAGMTTLTGGPLSASGYVGDGIRPASGTNLIGLNIVRIGGTTNVTADNVWAHYGDMRVLGRRMDKFGALVSGAGGMVTADYVLASWVVADLMGRMMPWADPAASTIETTTAHIDQLAYWQAVPVSQVLDDLALWEADMLYEVLASTTPGKRVFNYRRWPGLDSPRYEVTTRDGYSRPGSDQGQCNRLIVSYTDKEGHANTETVTAVVPDLDSKGRIRHAEGIALPGVSDESSAQAIGAQTLAAINANAVTSMRVTVKRPVLDLYYGQLVQPWEIEPGYPARVRETGDVQRLTQMTYQWDDNGTSQADLTLGLPVLSPAQRLKRLDAKSGSSFTPSPIRT